VGRLRVAHLRLAVPFLLIAWTAALPIGDNSFLWHVRAGELQLEIGRVLTTDPFSFTAGGEAWRTQSWLAELGYAWLEDVTGGISWVPAMKLLAMGAAIGLLGMVIYRVVGRRTGLTLLGLLALVWQGAPFAVSRPALLGFVLLAAVVAFTHLERRPLWMLPVLFWLWASVHGMFAVGLGYLLLDGFRRRSRRQIAAVVISGAVTALTAHGLGTWWIVLQFLRNRGALDLISEWQPPDFSNPFILPLLVVILGIVVAGAFNKLEAADLWIVVPFVAFGLVAERNVWPAFLVLVPIAARALTLIPTRLRKARAESVAVNWVIAAILVLVAGFAVTRPVELSEDRFPAAEAIAALDPMPLFNGSAVGGYLIYDVWPELSVFIDDRAELYGAEQFQRFHDVKSGIGVMDTFSELGIGQVVVSADWPIVEYLELAGWEYRYQDEFFVVMAAD
jgi:hypothetical protein